MSRSQANALLLLAGAIWGIAFIAQATAMDDIGASAVIATTGIFFLSGGDLGALVL